MVIPLPPFPPLIVVALNPALVYPPPPPPLYAGPPEAPLYPVYRVLLLTNCIDAVPPKPVFAKSLPHPPPPEAPFNPFDIVPDLPLAPPPPPEDSSNIVLPKVVIIEEFLPVSPFSVVTLPPNPPLPTLILYVPELNEKFDFNKNCPAPPPPPPLPLSPPTPPPPPPATSNISHNVFCENVLVYEVWFPEPKYSYVSII